MHADSEGPASMLTKITGQVLISLMTVATNLKSELVGVVMGLLLVLGFEKLIGNYSICMVPLY